MYNQSMPKGKMLMEPIAKESKKISASLDQLIKYTIQTFMSLIILSLFLCVSICASWLSNIAPDFTMGVVFRVIGWFISVSGAMCAIALVFRNTIVFVRFLIIGPSEESSGGEVAEEGRIQ